MRFDFVPMTVEFAKQMQEWKYDGVVKRIYVQPYFESFHSRSQFLSGPGGCRGYAALERGRLVGLFEYYPNEILEIGLALSPEMKGKGYGAEFVSQGVHFGTETFAYDGEYIKLTVNEKNVPAIKSYEKAGFVQINVNEEGEVEMRLANPHRL